MEYAIITGPSKGLGESIAILLLESNIHVYGISRTENEKLTKIAAENNVTYTHFTADLGNLHETEETIGKVKRDLHEKNVSRLYVINNAAVVQPIKQATDTTGDSLSYHFQVNVVAPMLILNNFVRNSIEKSVPLIGVNITSGAANRPIYGWSAYCSSKASISMYTETIALEQEQLNTGNKIIAFSPGVMDTNMQAEIRASERGEFIDIDTFKHYKEQNLLSDAVAVASVLIDIMTDEDIKNGKIYDVKDYF